MTKTDKKINLGARVEEILRQRLLNLEYPANHVLVEESLCSEFGVSRSPIREALRALESSDLIHKTSTRSYAVKQISQTGVRELYETRLALERYVVEKLCRKEDKNGIASLLAHWQGIIPEKEENLATADRLFHEGLAELYGNHTILDELRRINDRLRVFREVDFSKSNRNVSTKFQHVELLKAIQNGDIVRALECIEINIDEGLQNALAALREAILRSYEK